MALLDILVHRAVPSRIDTFGPIIEGEREEARVDGVPFALCLFPTGVREGDRAARRVDQPMMLVSGFDVQGRALWLHAEDRIRVTSAPGLQDRDLAVYEVDGEPLPLGKPGLLPKGYQVNLKRVID